MKTPTDMAASVRQRLLNLARRDKRPFHELLQYYAMERFLYRLSRSAHADDFISDENTDFAGCSKTSMARRKKSSRTKRISSYVRV